MRRVLPPANATFNAANGTITFATTIPASISHILRVSNLDRAVVYFDPTNQTNSGVLSGATYASPVLTLKANTSTHSNTDRLYIEYDDGQGLVDVQITGPVTVSSEVEIKNDSGNPVPVTPAVQQGGGAITATTQRVTLATDGPGVAALNSLDTKTPALSNGRQPVEAFVPARTPTTTSVASSTSSGTLLAANANRRGVAIHNDSTASLRLSFSSPATASNAFLTMAPGSFLLLDQQLMVTVVIYGIWTAANGTAQVTEFV